VQRVMRLISSPGDDKTSLNCVKSLLVVVNVVNVFTSTSKRSLEVLPSKARFTDE